MTDQQMTDEPMTDQPTSAQPLTVEPIRPQLATEARVGINSPHWSFEPFWIGERLLARLADGQVRLTDAGGQPVDEFYRDLADILRTSVDADQAVLDRTAIPGPWLGCRALVRGPGR